MNKKVIITDKAPEAIGAYSQAVKAGNLIFISGQIPLDPSTMEVISPVFSDQVEQVIKNLDEITKESGKSLDDIVKITVYLKNLDNFQAVNQAMEKFFTKPYPARAAVEISKLPKDVEIEMDAIVLAK